MNRRNPLLEVLVKLDVLSRTDERKPWMRPTVVARRERLPEHTRYLMRFGVLVVVRNAIDARVGNLVPRFVLLGGSGWSSHHGPERAIALP